MLLRKNGTGVIAIPQPSHAWLSGQLARAWGNELFAPPAPAEEVCLAAEQHDIGWLTWETAPALDPETGLPQEFFKMPAKIHTVLWQDGVNRACAFGRYPALLISLHADTIYGRYFNFATASVEDAEAVRAFLDGQHRFQEQMAASLRAEPKIAELASPGNIERSRLLIAALDWLSLAICRGVKEKAKIPDVPVANGRRTDLILVPQDPEGHGVLVEPWPFRKPSLTVRAEGKRLTGRFSNQHDLQRALKEAEPVLLIATLRAAMQL